MKDMRPCPLPFTSRVFAPLLALGAFLAPLAMNADDGEPCQEVALEGGRCGSSTVMVFGMVGDAFHYELVGFESDSSRHAPGLGATGEQCVLPQGLSFDQEELTLSGVPRQPGFYEFVLLSTEQGVTRERVVLIDIQAPDLSAGGSAYAAYFFGGIR